MGAPTNFSHQNKKDSTSSSSSSQLSQIVCFLLISQVILIGCGYAYINWRFQELEETNRNLEKLRLAVLKSPSSMNQNTLNNLLASTLTLNRRRRDTDPSTEVSTFFLL